MFFRSLGLLILAVSISYGNIYYIDYEGGSDANTGTSIASPWKRCPGMNGFSAVYTHTPGDVFTFKGGVVWPSAALPLTITQSGSAGKTDTYTADRSWFTKAVWEKPVLDGQLFGKTLLSASGVSYIKINDMSFVNAGSLTANGIIAFRFINCSFVELSNNTFAPEAWGSLYFSWEKTGDYHDILVHHNDISRCAFAMRFVPAAPAAIVHNVQAYNNAIHDFHSQLSGAVHGDGIQHYCSPDNATSFDRYIDGFKIFNNHFYGDFSQMAGSGGAMTALIYLSGSSIGVQIYNNVFAPHYSGTQSPNFFESFISLRDNPNRGGHHKIYNNTFVTPVPGGQSAAILEDDSRFPSPGLDIKNNIFSNFNWAFDLRSPDHTIDYNNIFCIRDIGKWMGAFVGTFARWQALGLDAHGVNANPGFVSSSDLHLTAGSPGIGKGINISSILTTDIDGIARPLSSAFCIGAYEFGGMIPVPPAVPEVPAVVAPVVVPPAVVPPAVVAPEVPAVVPAAPTLVWPDNGATGIGNDPSLTWSADSMAQSFAVQVATDPDFSAPIINKTSLDSTTYDVEGLASAKTYYWRVGTVAAGTAGDTAIWSPIYTFTLRASQATATITASSLTKSAPLEIYRCQADAVQLSIPVSGSFRLSLYTPSGRQVYNQTHSALSAGPVTVSLGSGSILPGFYIVRLTADNRMISKKLSVTR